MMTTVKPGDGDVFHPSCCRILEKHCRARTNNTHPRGSGTYMANDICGWTMLAALALTGCVSISGAQGDPDDDGDNRSVPEIAGVSAKVSLHPGRPAACRRCADRRQPRHPGPADRGQLVRPRDITVCTARPVAAID